MKRMITCRSIYNGEISLGTVASRRVVLEDKTVTIRKEE